MTNMTVADLAAAAALPGESSTGGVQPTASSVSRFEQQLQAPVAEQWQFYQSPLPAAVGANGNWQGLMSDIGKISEQYRVDSASLDGAPGSDAVSLGSGRGTDPVKSAEVFQQGMSKLTHMSYTMMSISFVTTAERLAGENVRSLFQLG